MISKDKIIMEQYRENKVSFELLGDIVQEILEKLVHDAGIRVMTVEHRVKKELWIPVPPLCLLAA